MTSVAFSPEGSPVKDGKVARLTVFLVPLENAKR